MEGLGLRRRQIIRFMVPLMNFFDELLDDDEDETQWEKITVNVEEYRLMGDPSFRLHFRLTKPMFEELLIVLKDYLIAGGRLVRERRQLSHILLMVLWILATPDSFRSVALRFGVHPGTVHEYYAYVIEALTELGQFLIKWPNLEQRQRMKASFQRRSGFPGVVGIIDVCHVPISAPLEEPAAYRDYKQQYSISVQAVCDDRYLITDLYLGEAGSLHDARVFRRSPLFANFFRRDDLLSPGEHIIGDGAYMLLNEVMVPFDNDGHLTQRQLNYNRRLSQIRCRVEHLFAHSQSLWRRLQYLPFRNMDYGLDHIAASFVLHNFRVLQGDRYGMFGDIPRVNVREEDRPIVPLNPFLHDANFNDHLPDPYVPHDVAPRIRISQLRGEQKRWDICDDLPWP